jgi:hypothetical protein
MTAKIRNMRTFSILLAGCGMLAAQTHRFTLEDLVSVEPIGESVVSPDGKTFAMARGGQIVLMPSDGGWPTRAKVEFGSCLSQAVHPSDLRTPLPVPEIHGKQAIARHSGRRRAAGSFSKPAGADTTI